MRAQTYIAGSGHLERRMLVYIGIDDTDSPRGMCTTYVAARALRAAEGEGARAADHPWLVRLNPNCPYKTRGNAAVCLPLEVERSGFDRVWEAVLGVVRELAELENGADPGVAAFPEENRGHLERFYFRAVREMVEVEEALELAERYALAFWRHGEGRGIVGAVAAAGASVGTLTTYELLAYRRREMWGRERWVDPESVVRMDALFGDRTFDNFDYEKGEVRLTPHTPCPVLLGIRGTSPEVLPEALSVLRLGEPYEFYQVFRTNQATDVHYQRLSVKDLRPLVSAIVTGRVVGRPRIGPGGHVFFEIDDGTGSVTVAVYEPTGKIREIALRLVEGDLVEVYGAVKAKPQGLTLNLEKLRVIELRQVYAARAPACPVCGKTMESAGRNQGYRCERCGHRDPRAQKVLVAVDRGIRPGLYEVAVSARRHLVRPLRLEAALRASAGT
ncbi:MAG: tRNA(Ile)(2)-agmatinylcytidine synthase [Nitrososphaerota archaeon]